MRFRQGSSIPVRVAVIGFSSPRFHRCRVAAYYLGQYLAKSGYMAVGANVTGVFDDVFCGVRSLGGCSCALLESSHSDLPNPLKCERLRIVSNRMNKHRLLASMADMGVVIGGGRASKRIIFKLLMQKKPVWAYAGSGGIVAKELGAGVIVLDSMELIFQAIENYYQHQMSGYTEITPIINLASG
jgi:hypothetical protein